MNNQNDVVKIHVNQELDIYQVVRKIRQFAQTMGFSTIQASYIATAASELAANIYIHAGGGLFFFKPIENCVTHQRGLQLMTLDNGAGICDIALAMQEGFSTSKGLGCGLSGVKRLMDELFIENLPEGGLKVTANKWLSDIDKLPC